MKFVILRRILNIVLIFGFDSVIIFGSTSNEQKNY